jgi:hypothetical protein
MARPVKKGLDGRQDGCRKHQGEKSRKSDAHSAPGLHVLVFPSSAKETMDDEFGLLQMFVG